MRGEYMLQLARLIAERGFCNNSWVFSYDDNEEMCYYVCDSDIRVHAIRIGTLVNYQIKYKGITTCCGEESDAVLDKARIDYYDNKREKQDKKGMDIIEQAIEELRG